MAGGFLAALGGAMSGAGGGIVEQARARREAAIAAMKEELAYTRASEERAYQSDENKKTRDANASENEKTRDQQSLLATQNQDFQREGRGDPVQLEDGSYGNRVGSTVTPIVGSDGKPVKIRSTTTGEKPSEIKAAEWLIEKGVAKDATEAWQKVKQAADNPNSRAKLVLDAYKTLKEDIRDRRTDEEKRGAAQSLVDDLISQTGDEQSSPTSPAQVPDAPRDIKQRQVGKTYKAFDGRKVRWTGDRWEPAP